MSSGLKILARAGVGGESAFGTGVACSQDLQLLSESIKVGSVPRAGDFSTGGRSKEYVGKGLIALTGNLAEQMRYLLTSDPAHILLKQAFGSAFGHTYRGLVRDSYIALRSASNTAVELSYPVTPATTASAGVQVRAFLKRLGNPSGNLSVEIQTNSVGDPSGTAVTNGTSANVSAASVSTAGEWVTFTFATSPTLTASTTYHVVLKGTYSVSATDNVQLAYATVGDASGNLEVKNSSYAADDTAKKVCGRLLNTSFIDSYLMANSIEGQSATIAIDKGVSVHEFLGMKVKGLTLESTPAGMLKATYDMVGYDETQSPTNTSAILTGLRRTRGYPLHSDMGSFWVGDQSAALSSSNAFKIDSWSLKQIRGVDNVAASGARQIIEPLENALGDVQLSVKLPRYAADTFRAWQTAETKLQIKTQWTDGTYYLTHLAANAIIDGAVAIETGDKAPYAQDITFRLFRNAEQNGIMAVQDEHELTYSNV